MNKTSLIIGGTGQDGYYLSQLLIYAGNKVYISTRSLASSKLWEHSNIDSKTGINLLEINLLDQNHYRGRRKVRL